MRMAILTSGIDFPRLVRYTLLFLEIVDKWFWFIICTSPDWATLYRSSKTKNIYNNKLLPIEIVSD